MRPLARDFLCLLATDKLPIAKQSRSSTGMTTYAFGQVELDTSLRRLAVAGQPVDVGARAFDLLVALIESRERTLSKQWLLEKVWPDVVVEESNLYVHISALRRAIGVSAITTIPGRGYRFTGQLRTSGDAAPSVESGSRGQTPAPPTAEAGRSEELAPSIVVLPFKTLGVDDSRMHLIDGIVDDIVTALSQLPRLRVIGSGSSFVYRGRNVDIRTVGRELAVRYVLDGSVRLAGEKLRLNARLAETEGGRTLWAEQLDGAIEDLLDFQDDLTTRVVMAIVPSVDAAEVTRARALRPDSLPAYDLYLRALARIREMTAEGSDAAIELLNESLRRQPGFAAAAGLAAWAYALRIPQGWARAGDDETTAGLALAQTAIADDVADPEALSRGGYAMAFLSRDPQRGLPAVEKAIQLAPSHASSRIDAGWVNCYCGRHERAIAHLHNFIRLSPRDPMLFRAHCCLAFAHIIGGDFEAAVAWAKRALSGNARFTPTHRALASALGHAGCIDEARRAVGELVALVPGLSVERFAQETRFQPGCGLETIVAGLRRAGLPER